MHQYRGIVGMAFLAAGTGLLLGSLPARAQEFIEFSIRAAPARAAQVDALLAKYVERSAGEPLPPGGASTPGLCASGAGPSDAQAGAAPCVNARHGARVRVQPGDTLETIAKRHGLHASEVAELSYAEPVGMNLKGPIDPKRIRPGEVITVPTVPQWTDFRVSTGKVSGHSQMMSKLAEGLGCGSEEPAPCLARLGVFVLAKVRAERVRRPVDVSHWVGSLVLPPPPEASSEGRLRLVPPANIALSPVVAKRQWPYDAELVRLVLADAMKSGAPVVPSVIGIAEAGLAGRDGRPLPREVFIGNGGEVPPKGTEGVDDDGNGYVDDSIGGGGRRSGELADNGDLAFCFPNDPDPYDSLTTLLRQQADHGPIVASIAAGLPLRVDRDLHGLLPRIVFYRLGDGNCALDGTFEALPMAVEKGVQYLADREVSVINVSYSFSGLNGDTIARSIVPAIRGRLLVVPSGNAGVNLDEEPRCPPCLANPGYTSSSAELAARVLVVGAATRELAPAHYSGWGHSVRLFAPGVPFGAIDALGREATPSTTGTSNAAPYAAFAAAIMRSLGMEDFGPLVLRLQLATWPMRDFDGRRSPSGVLDLAKAVAVRHWAIEVKETDEDGTSVLRTYVGNVPQEAQSFPICDGAAFSGALFQAVRFDDPDATGRRTVTAYTRNIDTFLRLKRSIMPHCSADGVVRIKDLRDGEKEIALKDVTAVFAPFRQ